MTTKTDKKAEVLPPVVPKGWVRCPTCEVLVRDSHSEEQCRKWAPPPTVKGAP